MLATVAKNGVSLDKNDNAVGSTLDRGEVTRLSSDAVLPINRTVATISEPRQTLPRDGPEARCNAAVVISTGSTEASLSVSTVASLAYRWKYHSPTTAATATRPIPRMTPHVHIHAKVTRKIRNPAYGLMWNTHVFARLRVRESCLCELTVCASSR